jgi:hypothetical protein
MHSSSPVRCHKRLTAGPVQPNSPLLPILGPSIQNPVIVPSQTNMAFQLAFKLAFQLATNLAFLAFQLAFKLAFQLATNLAFLAFQLAFKLAF